MSSESLASGEQAVADELTHHYPGIRLNHTMLRVRDPSQSLRFYVDVLGMSRIFTLNTGPATVYYLGYPSSEDKVPSDILKSIGSRTGLLELVQIHSTPASVASNAISKDGKDGVEGPLGFGHLGFNVPDVQQVLTRAEKSGYVVQKRPEDVSGKHLGIAAQDHAVPFHEDFLVAYTQIGFLRDPDGYLIELLPQMMKR